MNCLHVLANSTVILFSFIHTRTGSCSGCSFVLERADRLAQSLWQRGYAKSNGGYAKSNGATLAHARFA